jgi:hypothetical protein
MGGILERSRVRFERREAEEEDRECCGEVSILNVVVVNLDVVRLKSSYDNWLWMMLDRDGDVNSARSAGCSCRSVDV